jgi:hypothetical protein
METIAEMNSRQAVNEPVEPAVEPKVETPVEPVETKEEEFDIKSILAPKKEPVSSPESKDQPSPEVVDTKFNLNDIEKITDPVAKEVALKAYKSFEKGYQEKFQSLAQMKRELEQKLSQDENWTPERIQKLITNKEFVEASTRYMQSQPTHAETDEYETEEAKAIRILQSEINHIKTEAQQKEYNANIASEDSKLAQTYGNYIPSEMEQLRKDMFAGKVKVTSEHMYKAFKHDDNVKAAYEAGRKSVLQGNKEKYNASTPVDDGKTVVSSDDRIKRNEGESAGDFYIRAALTRLKQFSKK